MAVTIRRPRSSVPNVEQKSRCLLLTVAPADPPKVVRCVPMSHLAVTVLHRASSRDPKIVKANIRGALLLVVVPHPWSPHPILSPQNKPYTLINYFLRNSLCQFFWWGLSFFLATLE